MKSFWAEKNPAGLVRLANLATLGRKVDENVPYDPSDEWCRDTVLSEHSTMDWASIVFVDDVRTDVVSQLVRHTKGRPRFSVQSWRPDWTGKPRPRSPEEKRILASKWSISALQAMGRERLCFLAMAETNEYIMHELRAALLASEDRFMRAVGKSMVPMCVYRAGCPFGKKCCGFWDIDIYDVDIWVRYENYSKIVFGLDKAK